MPGHHIRSDPYAVMYLDLNRNCSDRTVRIVSTRSTVDLYDMIQFAPSEDIMEMAMYGFVRIIQCS